MLSRQVVVLAATASHRVVSVFWSSGTRGAQSGHSVSSSLSTGSADSRQFFRVVSIACPLQMEECNKEKKREKRRQAARECRETEELSVKDGV